MYHNTDFAIVNDLKKTTTKKQKYDDSTNSPFLCKAILERNANKMQMSQYFE